MAILSRLAGGAAIALVLLLPAQVAAGHPRFSPGAPGIGDTYFPLDGNGGYDVTHYDLAFKFDPATGAIDSVATITAVATQNLSSFDLDLYGLDVRSIKVDKKTAAFSRSGQELIITPAARIRKASSFTTVVRYSGVTSPLVDLVMGIVGRRAERGRGMIVGQPHSAATWFPVNDHPADAASYSFEIAVPAGLQAVANGVPGKTSRSGGWTTWYLERDGSDGVVPGGGGDRRVRHQHVQGRRAEDPGCDRPRPVRQGLHHHGRHESGVLRAAARSAYKRLSHVIDVPAERWLAGLRSLAATSNPAGTSSSSRPTPSARTTGRRCRRTTPPARDHSDDPGLFCVWENAFSNLHPFLAHYETFSDDPSDDLDRCATRTGRPASGMPPPARAKAPSGGTSI